MFINLFFFYFVIRPLAPPPFILEGGEGLYFIYLHKRDKKKANKPGDTNLILYFLNIYDFI